jgi:cytochrome c nitrite reductase small subunit
MKVCWRWLGKLLRLGFLPGGWRLPVAGMLGAVAGLGGVVLQISRATSYLGDAPETCINCHVMMPQYLSWRHSSHAAVATCADCHVPHDSLLAKYAYKAKDGLWHATVFTMRWEPQAICLAPPARPVIEANCRRCHQRTLAGLLSDTSKQGGQHCWECHREVPHGQVRGLGAFVAGYQLHLPPAEYAGQRPTFAGRPIEVQTPASGGR